MYDNKKGGAIMNKTKMENQNIANILLHLRQKITFPKNNLQKKLVLPVRLYQDGKWESPFQASILSS